MELSTNLATFLEFALKATEDVVKSETALAGQVHAATYAAHANEPLQLHCWVMLATSTGLLFVKYTKNMGSDLVVDDDFVVFADGIDTELLVWCRSHV